MSIEIKKIVNIDQLMDPSNISRFQKAMKVVQKAQNNIAALNEKNDPTALKVFKAGTALTVAVLMKIEGGKFPADFTAEDWEDIVDHISDYAIEADGRRYSAYVFMFYSWFIEKSVEQIERKLPEEKATAIRALSEELRSRTKQLEEEEIDEVDYIDSCLWICLEAMIKLLSGTIDAALGFDKEPVVEAAMIFGLEYGRMVLYKKENELVTEYLENQKFLDVELANQYDQYIEALEKETARFDGFIDTAFASGFRETLKSSAELAMAAGVEEDEVLKTIQDVDDFFM